MTVLNTTPRPQNTAGIIADALRAAILQGKLESGQPLRQDRIAAEFDVSKIPVREALFQLQAEGLVNLIPNRGAKVSRLSLADVEEIYAIRIALETIVLRRSIPHMTTVDLLNAEMLLAKIDEAAADGDDEQWAQRNWDFHEALYSSAAMPRLLKIVHGLHTNVARYLTSNLQHTGYLDRSQQEHRDILDCCREGDVEEACRVLEQHLSGPVKKLATVLETPET